MTNEIQKAGVWKRIAAGTFDSILTSILAVGFAFLLSVLLNYDGYSETLEAGYDRYEEAYGVSFDISQEEYLAMTETDRASYDAAYQALIKDPEVLYAYNMTVNLMLVITTVGILLGILIMELLVPLFLGNGQTLGKKIFGLCLVRTDGVRVNNLQLFTRTLLGKFTLETMVPVNVLLMLFMGMLNAVGTLILLGLVIAQCICYLATWYHAMLHDLLAGTVVVDYASQMIFASTEDLIEHQKKLAAERAARQSY